MIADGKNEMTAFLLACARPNPPSAGGGGHNVILLKYINGPAISGKLIFLIVVPIPIPKTIH